MIRAAAAQDIPQLIRLWSICFEDEEDTIRMFLQRLNKDVACRVAERDGQVVAAAYLLEGKIVTPKGMVPVWYEYALGTMPEYRKQGIMTRLLESIKKEARRRRIPYTALVPADEKLAHHYEKLDYHWFFTVRKAEVSRDKLIQLGDSAAENVVSREEPDALRERMLRPLTGSLQWPAASVQFALRFAEQYGAMTVRVPGGYAVCYEQDDILHVTEWMSTPRSAPWLAKELCRRSSMPRVMLRLTEYNPLFPGVGEILPFAMLRSTGGEPLPKPVGAYLGLEMS